MILSTLVLHLLPYDLHETWRVGVLILTGYHLVTVPPGISL